MRATIIRFEPSQADERSGAEPHPMTHPQMTFHPQPDVVGSFSVDALLRHDRDRIQQQPQADAPPGE